MKNNNLKECLITRTIMLYALCCVLCFGVISCSDDNVLNPTTIEMPEDANLMELEMWSYELPFAITTEGEWIIETTGDFCYATPSQGSGSATVQLAILDNNEDVRQKGELKITFPDSPENNASFSIDIPPNILLCPSPESNSKSGMFPKRATYRLLCCPQSQIHHCFYA